jgi:sugar/nucleoside kinase (ribokinase family)
MKLGKVIIAGSLVLDIIPEIKSTAKSEMVFAEGKTTEVSGITIYLGGEVGNTGIAMYKLGAPVKLVSKIGEDQIGKLVYDMLNRYPVEFHLINMPQCQSSATIGINIPGEDKISLHARGASQTFTSDDITDELLEDTVLFHFGYPPSMQYLYADEGKELLKLLKKIKSKGITTSLDMSLPDLNSPPGQVDWKKILENAFPYIDIFMPSLEETLFLMERKKYTDLVEQTGRRNMIDYLDMNLVKELGDTILSGGVKILVIKAGKKGLYLHTTDKRNFQSFGLAYPKNIASWCNRELWETPYEVENISSTTGAGDTAIAGFLSSFLRGDKPEKAMKIASLTAAQCIQSFDTTSNIYSLEKMDKLLLQGKEKVKVQLDNSFWAYNAADENYISYRS